jgi:predicted kinase
VAESFLARGLDVILDFGLWTRAERQDFRARAAALRAGTTIHFVDVPFEELLVRVERRNRRAPEEVTIIPVGMMLDYLPRFEPPGAEELALNAD